MKDISKEFVIYSNANLSKVVKENQDFINENDQIPQEVRMKRAISFEKREVNVNYVNT